MSDRSTYSASVFWPRHERATRLLVYAWQRACWVDPTPVLVLVRKN